MNRKTTLHVMTALTAIAVTALSSLPHAARAAAPGDLDLAFSGTGYNTQADGDRASGNAVIADTKNRVVMAYYATSNAPGPTYNTYGVVRYLSSGALDLGFGSGGVASLPLPSKDLICAPELVEDESANLLIASCDANTLFVWRLKPNGVLDTGYGAGGLASIFVGNGTYPVIGLTQYKNRAMIAASSIAPGATRPRFTLARLNALGAADTSLAGTGVARYNVLPGATSEISRATDVKVDRAGRIVIGGRARNTPTLEYQFTLARVSWSGTLDAAFGAAGVTSFPVMSGNNFGRRLAFDTKDRILLAGSVCKPADPVTGDAPCYAGLARLLGNGALDTSLIGGTGTMAYGGGGGPANPAAGFCSNYTYTYGMTIFKDRIYLAGTCDLSLSSPPPYPSSNVAYVLRLDGNGQYDTSFGYTLNGFTYYDYGAPEAFHAGIAIDKTGLILAAGRGGKTVSDTEAYSDAVTARMIQ
jgi:uncharacterized delta-60 repeat protein